MIFKLDGRFGDNMVLQRDRPVTIRGSARAGSMVRVELGQAAAEGSVDGDGRWEIVLPAFGAGGPHELRASCGGETIGVQNILIGEVWICCGQSNMDWTVAISPGAAETRAGADQPMIRLWKVNRVCDPEPPKEAAASWRVCSPATIGDYSKVGYHHGLELFRTLQVPIGLVDAAWGGTVVEAWTPRAVLVRDAEMAPQVAEYEAMLPRHAERLAAYEATIKGWNLPADPGNAKFAAGWADPAFDTTAWPQMTLPCWWEAGGLRFHGAFWFRREIEVPAELAGRDLMLHLGACDKADTTYFNNEQVGAIPLDFPDGWREPRNYQVPGRLVRAGRNTIAVRVFSNLNNSGMTGPRDAMRMEAEGWSAPLAGPWKFQVEHNLGWVVRPPAPWGAGNINSPAIMFTSLISPLLGMSLRGVIFYQGESNEGTPARYARLFPAMIRGWREAWGQGDFPFLFVQLPNFGPDESSPSFWSEIRHAQERGLLEPATAMVPTIDIGDPNDLHPPNKAEVGQRLAWAALALAYGDPDPTLLSPRIEDVAFRGDEARLRFAPIAGGLGTRNGNAEGFELAGEGDFVPAHAQIEGAEIILRSDLVAKPRAVRYAFSDRPIPNLANRRGLPLTPFRFRIDAPPAENSLIGTPPRSR